MLQELNVVRSVMGLPSLSLDVKVNRQRGGGDRLGRGKRRGDLVDLEGQTDGGFAVSG